MKMIIGGAWQGKLDYAVRTFGIKREEILEGAEASIEELYEAKAVYGFHRFIKKQMQKGVPLQGLADTLYEKNPLLTVITDEIGCGIVPVDDFEREYREQTGRICCKLAEKSAKVYRVYAGIGQCLKDQTEIYLFRHGKTKGNLKKRYIGITDEPLCEKGIKELKGKCVPKVHRIYTSPMKRCIETADLFYPSMEQQSVKDLRECDFGEFENKNYQELSANPHYQAWIDSNGTMDFPGGESNRGFKERCIKAFEGIVEQCCQEHIERIGIVTHGGVIMSIMEKYGRPESSFYDWQIENGGMICLVL